MDGKLARILFLGVCIVLAGLLFTKQISTIVGASLFAIALLTLGGLSRGFRPRGRMQG